MSSRQRRIQRRNSTLQILKEEFALEDYAVCIDKSNTELKEKINEALAKLKENGTLQDIIDNYIGEDSVKGTKPYKAKDIKRNGVLKDGNECFLQAI